jgi:hypothetical protein
MMALVIRIGDQALQQLVTCRGSATACGRRDLGIFSPDRRARAKIAVPDRWAVQAPGPTWQRHIEGG